MDVDTATELLDAIKAEVERSVILDSSFLDTILAGFLAGGHVLLEDVPGTGKTLTARSVATALGLDFNRIQFTPDLLPADITGSYVYDEQDGSFEFEEGPIFANVVLADEINRAPPKTQAALLEAMEEGQVSASGTTHALPQPFFVMATQNPVEQKGTFELPEAQRDRFIVKSSIGYPDSAGEISLIERRAERKKSTPTMSSVVDADQATALRDVPETVTTEEEIHEYVVELGRKTRTNARVEVGVSPRGIQQLFEIARAGAVLDGREFVVPDDVKRFARPALRHRLVLTSEAAVRSVDPGTIVESVLNAVEVPAMTPE
ncbi:MAG: AAA family ATPase [Halococcoides sp.]